MKAMIIFALCFIANYFLLQDPVINAFIIITLITYYSLYLLNNFSFTKSSKLVLWVFRYKQQIIKLLNKLTDIDTKLVNILHYIKLVKIDTDKHKITLQDHELRVKKLEEVTGEKHD